MKSLLDRCLEETDRLRNELRRGIEFIESGTHLNATEEDLETLKARLSALNSLVEKYINPR
jgi:hypothetical protein